jgi:hypothetical protein
MKNWSGPGVLLAGDGLHPSKKGARVRFSGKDRLVIDDSPFAETKELIAGSPERRQRNLAVDSGRRRPEGLT